jgi:2-polyprenyl-3-methyl-5-hydroxy-6-metoxy-1,4-benzoquinol methylase
VKQSFIERAYWGIRRRIRSLFGVEEQLQRKYAKAEAAAPPVQSLKKASPGVTVMTDVVDATGWWTQIDPPPLANLARVSGNDYQVFVRMGRTVARRIAAHIDEWLGTDRDLTILDFGCGCGRIAMPMFFEHGKITHACDIDDSATTYLASQLPSVDVRTTPFKPPLPFGDSTFDVVYSISIWTHLREEDQLAWLAEMRRIIKPGGYLMATTSSYKAIEHRKFNMKIPAWQDVEPEQLREAGIMYRESATLQSHAEKWFPGVTDSYGQTSNDPAYIMNRWSDYFILKRHLINDIGGVQDMNIMLNGK